MKVTSKSKSKAEIRAAADARIAAQKPSGLFPHTDAGVVAGPAEPEKPEPAKNEQKPAKESLKAPAAKKTSSRKKKKAGGKASQKPAAKPQSGEKLNRNTAGRGPLLRKLFNEGKTVKQAYEITVKEYPWTYVASLEKTWKKYAETAKRKAKRESDKEKQLAKAA